MHSIYQEFKTQEIVTSAKNAQKGKVYTYCPNCNKITTQAKPFCDDKCKTAYYNYTNVIVSKMFVKMLLRIPKEDVEQEIIDFCKRHDFELVATKKKIQEAIDNICKKNPYLEHMQII